MSKPNPQQKQSKTLYVVGGLALLGALIFSMSGNGDTTPAKTTTPVAKSSDSTVSSDIKPEDYTAHFASLKDPIKDNFHPLVGKSIVLPPGQEISMDLAGSDGWGYTGMGSIDGKPQATLENSKTGESDLVGVGDHWKLAKVQSISDFQIVMIDQKGKAVSWKMGEAVETKGPGGINAVLSAAAPQPPLVGTIGPLSVTPMTVAPNTGAAGNAQGNGRRGRRRRNNGANGAQGTDNGDQNGS